MAKEVVLLDYWPSMFGMRARLALAEKGVDYDYQEQDLCNKSELLLKMNPVCESLIIVEYTDEVWADRAPLLPSDPYDKKMYGVGRRIWSTKGEEQEKAKAEFIEIVKVLEEQALGDKTYFGGEKFGFVDVALLPYYTWFYSFEVEGNFKVEDTCPKLAEWAKRCMQRDSVVKALPHPHKVHGFVLELKEKLGV